MPIYQYECSEGHIFTEFYPLSEFKDWAKCHCHRIGQLKICAPLIVTVAGDVCYDSPVTGEPVTSWAARRNDLAKHECQPYDEGMKQDYHNRINASEAALEKTISSSIEEAIEKMPTAKRGKLMSEMTEQGMTADAIRTVPHA